MNKILNNKANIGILVGLFLIILGVGYWYWNSKNYNEKLQSQDIIPKSLENTKYDQSPPLAQNINNQTQELTRYSYKDNFIEAGYELDSWNLYASIKGKKKLIFSHTGGFEGSGGQFATTTQPYIALVTFGEGDMGGGSNQLIFINLINGNYLKVQEIIGTETKIQRNGKDYKSFSMYVNDNCGIGSSRQNGEILAAVTGIGQYNIFAHDKISIPKGYSEELYFAFSEPKFLTCDNDRELGYTGFKESYGVHLIAYSDDFTKLYFKASGDEPGGKNWNEYFEYHPLTGTFSTSIPMQKSFKLVYEN